MKPYLRGIVPDALKKAVRRSSLNVKHRSRYQNVYHCCVQRTASQWLTALLDDNRFIRHSGLERYTYEWDMDEGYDPRPIDQREFAKAFPTRTICSPLYLGYTSFANLPKPKSHRAFFVYRDPRDIVTSWYDSTRYSHGKNAKVLENRAKLESLDQNDGYRFAVDYLMESQLFPSINSWLDVPATDPHVCLVRYEDLTGPEQNTVFADLLSWIDVPMPDDERTGWLSDYAFRKVSAGRQKGEEARDSHYRRGIHGDWEGKLNASILTYLDDQTDNLTARLGY